MSFFLLKSEDVYTGHSTDTCGSDSSVSRTYIQQILLTPLMKTSEIL